jgi:hypothetical protein
MPDGRRGVPPTLDRVIRTRKDGTPVTAADHILDRIRLGADFDDATAGADITRQTLWNWRRAGGNARAKATQGLDLDEREQRYADFLDALETAEAEVEASRLFVVTRAAEGGAVVTKKLTKRRLDTTLTPPRMVVVEEIERTETLAPVWTAAAWFLERRFPEKYRRRYEIEGSMSAGVSAEERARDLADSLRAYMQGIADAEEAVEVKAKTNGNGRGNGHRS